MTVWSLVLEYQSGASATIHTGYKVANGKEMRTLNMGPVVEVAKLGSRDKLCIVSEVVFKNSVTMTENEPSSQDLQSGDAIHRL